MVCLLSAPHMLLCFIDLQIIWRHQIYNSPSHQPAYRDGMTGYLQPFPGMTAGVWQMRPESRGYVRALTPNPDDAPIIQPNYHDASEDQLAIVAGLHGIDGSFRPTLCHRT